MAALSRTTLPLMLLLLLTAQAAFGAKLTVTAKSANQEADLILYLYEDADQFGSLGTPSLRFDVLTAEPMVMDVPAGDYAILLFQDDNGNGELDRNFIGIPREPIALSNGYRPKGPPSFQRAQIRLSENEPQEQTMELYRPLGPSGQLGVGIGMVGQSSPYRDSNAQPVQPIPAIFYIGERLQWTGPRVRYTLTGSTDWRLALQGDLRLGAYEDADSSYLADMGDRDTTFMLGLAVIGDLPGNFRLSGSVSQDLFDRSGGQVASLSLSRGFQWGNARLSPSVGINWLSDDLADYEFGVPASAATKWRPSYSPGSALNPELGLSVFYEITTGWQLIGNIGVEQLDTSLTDSPLVDEKRLVKGFLALGYTF
ncbi:MipA/OmpV family protein [Marinimicrobium agarilyticum]|uniref:MipA/OmpV family protein n=1 Tax=Marinimicrobium agarilyticum TaxID=306546 RepID=UPI0004194ADB|nr:MipA/OmpV family protein [Marinimicrobium agarilyticum]